MLSGMGTVGAGVTPGGAPSGKAVADDGTEYDTVQAAVDAATDVVRVGPGTFSETVNITTSGLTLAGSGGRGTLIDGSSGHAIVLEAANATVSNLSVQNTSGQDSSGDGLTTTTGADAATVTNVTVRDSDGNGLHFNTGTDHQVQNCRIEAADAHGINSSCARTSISGCNITNAHNGIILTADDCTVANCIIRGNASDGVYGNSPSSDCIVIANRIHNNGSRGIRTEPSAPTYLIANNRCSGNPNGDIVDDSTSATLDANVTGASN